MKKFPKITIITPSFNQGVFLEQTIRSVLDQHYPALEYMIIDGGSRDNSLEIIQKYQKYLTYWVSEPDTGQSEAINKGLARAMGDIVNWLNSDDYYQPGALHKVAQAFADPAVNVVCGRGHLFREEGRTLYTSNGTDIYPGNLAKTIGWARMDQPETFFRKTVIDQIGPLDTRLHYLMDRDWWIKYLFLYGLDGVAKIPDVLVNFRLHGASKTVSQRAAFQVEHDSFYHSLAKTFGFDELAQTIAGAFAVNQPFAIQVKGKYDRNLVEKALQYYLLWRADEQYASNHFGLCRKLLKGINRSLLEGPEHKLWYTLFMRSMLPASIVKLVRKAAARET